MIKKLKQQYQALEKVRSYRLFDNKSAKYVRALTLVELNPLFEDVVVKPRPRNMMMRCYFDESKNIIGTGYNDDMFQYVFSADWWNLVYNNYFKCL